MRGERAVARRIDHINVRVEDPWPLFRFLSERLELPVLWPPTAMPGFTIAGVWIGNVHMEPTRYAGRGDGCAGAAYPFAVCLEPGPVEDAAAELRRRGIATSAPIPYYGDFPASSETELFARIASRRGRQRLWTWLFVGGFLGDRTLERQYSLRPLQSPLVGRGVGRIVGRRGIGGALTAAMAPERPYPFFCEWGAFDIAETRRRAAAELGRRNGGPLGVLGVREVVIGARDLALETQRWQALFDPVEARPGPVWAVGDGPAIRLSPDRGYRIRSLVWEVASLRRARAFLDAEKLLGRDGDDGLEIDPRVVQGLEIRLVEAAAA
jgi:hypothetical protein